jgi:hypothetical protein
VKPVIVYGLPCVALLEKRSILRRLYATKHEAREACDACSAQHEFCPPDRKILKLRLSEVKA